jgi:Tol biopolymer transport system component
MTFIDEWSDAHLKRSSGKGWRAFADVEVLAMSNLALKKLDGSKAMRVRSLVLVCASLILASCDGANQGVQIGNGQSPDPVVVDFPIAYIKAPLVFDEDDGMLQQTDLRELITFDFGADLYVKDRASPSSPEINVTGDLMQGLAAIRDVEINFDGSAVVFAMRGPVNLNIDIDDEDQPTWNIWEYSFETGQLSRVIESDLRAETGHDVAPHYLPDGRIIFSSTRQLRSKAVLLDENKAAFEAFDEDENEPTFLLHVMDDDGSNIEQVTFNQSHDMDPAVLASGQVVFSRWDHAGPNDAINLYRMNPDGSQLEMLYGQNSHDTGTGGQTIQFTQPRELEDGRIMALIRPFTNTNGGGDIITIDTPTYLENTQPTAANPGMTGPAQARATTVDISTVPGEVSPGGRYSSVFPIQDGSDRMLVSWSQCRLRDIIDPLNPPPPEDIVYYPCTDENLLNALYEEADPIYGIWMYDPRTDTQLPVVPAEEGFMFTEVVASDPRPIPPTILDTDFRFNVDPDLVQNGEAVIHIRSVYDYDGIAALDIDALADPGQFTADERPARFIRVVKAVSLPDPDDLDLDNTAFGRIRNLGMKEIVGYGVVEPDGSTMIKVPANTALQVEILDRNGRRLVESPRHQNWLQLRPGQYLQCNGCHVPQGGLSHGRFEAFDSVYAGAQTPGASFNANTLDALFVGDVGETMAEVRARISCASDDCASIEPSMDIEYDDVWTDEAKSGRLADTSFQYAYVDLTTPPPTSVNCITQAWSPSCRIVVNYEMHIHPLWSASRPVLDPVTGMPVIDPVTMLPVTNDCTNCHTPLDAAGMVRVPAGQLDLADGLSPDEPDQFNSYRELLFNDDEQELVNGALVDRTVVVGTDPDTGDPILATVNVNPSMSAQGGNFSNRFFSRFDAGGSHQGYLSDAEKKLIAEWLDVGAQYYNNPFDVPPN